MSLYSIDNLENPYSSSFCDKCFVKNSVMKGNQLLTDSEAFHFTEQPDSQ